MEKFEAMVNTEDVKKQENPLVGRVPPRGASSDAALEPALSGTGERAVYNPPVAEAIAVVRVDVRVNGEFDYTIPPALAGQVVPGARVRVPFGSRTVFGTVLQVKPAIPSQPNPSSSSLIPQFSWGQALHPPVQLGAGSSSFELKSIIEVVGKTALLTPALLQLVEWMASYYLCPLDLVLRSAAPAIVRRRTSMRHVAPRHEAELDDAAADLVPTQPLSLTPNQAAALEKVINATKTPAAKPILLFGVTGSGKTEVYLQAMSHVLDEGKSAIMLVPEIALTPQTVERLRARFSSDTPTTTPSSPTPVGARFIAPSIQHPASSILAVLHSGLSQGERFREWQRIRSGEARLVVGARSAGFAPVTRLGLIVVDEEHENTYKQEESPRYHARDVAVMRGNFEGAVVVLGSATPSLESFHNTQIGKYDLCRMPERIDGRKLPTIRVVDMRAEISRLKKFQTFSEPLKAAIQLRLERGEQVILYLNRRGYASSMLCKKCGYVAMCPHCSITLSYHLREQKLKCHLCGFHQQAPLVCPREDCRDPSIRYAGLGTEKLEEIMRILCPQARLSGMVSDTMTHRHDYERTLLRFKMGKLDILLGTQMIAKGLDFPRVTLVGIVYADVGLHLPDFRSGERAFQQITQVAGRAGRGEVAGEVIIQTFTPDHLAIRMGRRQDFEGFYREETRFRKELDYPPFNHLTKIECASAQEKHAELMAAHLRQLLEERAGHALRILGPCPAPLGRVRGRHRIHLLLRDGRLKRPKDALRDILAALPRNKDVLVSADVDPMQML